jgi:hypothetical protein
MSIESVFTSTEGMEKVLAMGMEEGMTQAIGQIDAILAEGCVQRQGLHAEALGGGWSSTA